MAYIVCESRGILYEKLGDYLSKADLVIQVYIREPTKYDALSRMVPILVQ